MVVVIRGSKISHLLCVLGVRLACVGGSHVEYVSRFGASQPTLLISLRIDDSIDPTFTLIPPPVVATMGGKREQGVLRVGRPKLRPRGIRTKGACEKTPVAHPAVESCC